MDVMAVLREYLWLWLICGVVLVSGLIGVVVALINKCISRGGKHRVSQLQRGVLPTFQSNKYQATSPSRFTPPLPPRTQFIAEGQSYENLAETADYEQSVNMYEQNFQDYEELDQELPDYPPGLEEPDQALPVYQQSLEELDQALPDYQQSLVEQFDYVKVEENEEEEGAFPPPPLPQHQEPDPTNDDASTEDYDDIGAEDEEDYDDVG